MKPEKKERPPGTFDAANFPGLRQFFSGYLHEDFIDEYGSVTGAARAFFGDASLEETARARTEWTKLTAILDGQPISEMQTALQKLGGAWRPETFEELQFLDAAFEGTNEPTA
jgi:hypothetical protein